MLLLHWKTPQNLAGMKRAFNTVNNFECEASLISNIQEVFSVLANKHLIIRNVLTESESSLTREAIKMNIGE